MKKFILSVTCLVNVLVASGVKPIDNQLYKDECASCHFGFQPGLLNEESWKPIMKNLENHYGSDASLEKEDFDNIYNYIINNSADKATQYKRSYKIMKYMGKNVVDGVTKTPYFIKKHDEIPSKLIQQKEVQTISNCIACHTKANDGIYSERYIKIPNYGKWDD